MAGQYVGYKFVKKHAPQITFTGLFSLFMLAIPLVSILYLWLEFGQPSIGTNHVFMPGYDLFTYAIAIIKGPYAIYSGTTYGSNILMFLSDNTASTTIPAVVSRNVLKYLPLGNLLFVSLMCVFSFVLMIMGFKAIFAGKLKHFKGPTIFSTLVMCMALGNAIVTTVIFLCYTVFMGDNHAYSFGMWWLCWVYFGGALLLRVFIASFYEYGIYDHIYVNNAAEMSKVIESEKEKRVPDIIYIKDATMNSAQPVVNNPYYTMADQDVSRKVVQKPIVVNKRKDTDLPKNINTIGGHDYAENLSLTVAVIPDGISRLGVGAFANCINLKSVCIPRSVTIIEANCFFNCKKLTRINYQGTKGEWSKVVRGSNWLTKAGTQIVSCTDGAIIVNPYK